MHETALAVATLAVVLALALRTANAHSDGLTENICATFRVHHAPDQAEDRNKDVFVELLDENGTATECFLPQQEYWVRLSSSSLIKGFVLQAVTGARLPSQERKSELPEDVTSGPCKNSVSHTQIRTANSKDLVFPLSTRRSKKPLLLRYTVVFTLMSFLEDKYLEIPCCQRFSQVGPGEVNDTTTPPPVTSGSGVAFESGSGRGITTAPPTNPPYTTLPPLGNLANGTCGKTVENILKSRNETIDGVRYNCTINKPLKQTRCHELCEISGQPVRCQVFKIIPRRKGYTCVPYTDAEQADIDVVNYTITPTFDEVVTNGCTCYSAEQHTSEYSGDRS